jgi:acyl transferase domain-containing protein
VVGLGCRFPGAADPAAFWELLSEGRNAVGEIPRDRWDVDDYFDADPDAPGRMYTRHGGFIDAPDRFDPHVFGISPREAVSMDPQQRLVLEVSWEALEDAAIAPDSLMGSSTGVFLGSAAATTPHRLRGPCEHRPLRVPGCELSVAAGRLSYMLGGGGAWPWHGVLVLVAIHLACRAWTGEVAWPSRAE